MRYQFNEFMTTRRPDEYYMELALRAAEEAKSRGDIPVGAVLALPCDVCISDANSVFTEQDFTNHAEMNVLKKASQQFFRRLRDAVMYCTVEPCPMCAAAAAQSGIKEIVFGAYNKADGFSTCKALNENVVNLTYKGGIMAKECRAMMPERLQEHVVESLDESV